MTDPRTIEADPAWLPHRIDVSRRTVEFMRIPRSELGKTGFLAERKPGSPSDVAVIGWDDVCAMRVETGSLHFIFHTAFCRSTLLVRALDRPGVCVGLNEPGILASLAGNVDATKPLVLPVLQLLSRPHEPGEAVFVKPSNMSNMLIPGMLKTMPEARAIAMSTALPRFLGSVAKRGLLGRRWGRELFLDLQSYAGMDFGMSSRELFAMSDMQAAGLAWFLGQRWFLLHMHGQVAGISGDRFRSLDGDAFNAERAKTIAAIADFAGLSLDRDAAEEMAGADVFDEHAKLGGAQAAHEDEDNLLARDAKLAEEIGQVEQWVGMIAQQAGLAIPMKQTLF